MNSTSRAINSYNPSHLESHQHTTNNIIWIDSSSKIHNLKLRKKSTIKTYKIVKILNTISYLIFLLSFLYLVGIAGHSDYVSEAKIVDEWSMTDYIIKSIISLLIGGVAVYVGNLTDCIMSNLKYRIRNIDRKLKETKLGGN